MTTTTMMTMISIHKVMYVLHEQKHDSKEAFMMHIHEYHPFSKDTHHPHLPCSTNTTIVQSDGG
jgi:hypothetical protein